MDGTQIFLTSKSIEKLVQDLAEEVYQAYQGKVEELFLISPLKGSLFFLSDLVRKINIPLQVEFVQIDEENGEFFFRKDIRIPLKGKDILIVKEVINSGRKLLFLKNRLLQSQPKSLKILSLLEKPSRRLEDLFPDFFGLSIEDRYIVGYGLDSEERYRELSDLFYFTQ